ncbi:MAG: AEC family transporter [Rhodospirillales bacterium]|nr:AEC family transporter [Rhodospirillales bacterium]
MQGVLNVTLPFFALIGGGYALGRMKFLSQEGVKGLNTFVFYFALPCLLFRTMASKPIAEIFDAPFLAAYTVVGVVVFAVIALIGRLSFRCSLGQAGLQGQAAVVGNIGFLGLPLIMALMGDAAGVPVALGLLIDLIIIVPLTFALLEADRQTGNGWVRYARDLTRSMIFNPFVLSSGLGIIVSALGWGLPVPIDAFTKLLGGAAGPCALFALGTTLAGRAISSGLGQVSYMILAKLIVHPIAMWVGMVLIFPVDPMWAQAAIYVAAMPIGANLYIIAQNFDTYAHETSTAVLLSTFVAVFTVSALAAFMG